MPVDDLRAAVSDRAGRRCEYCRAPEEISGIRYHMDHVLPVARGGSDEIANRAFACPTCNQAKSVKTEFPDPFSSKRVKLFNPRIEDWQANFNIHMYMSSFKHEQKSIKTERLTLLTTKEFKEFLGLEARNEGISVAELVRNRCRKDSGSEEAVLAQLTANLRDSLAVAKSSLEEGIQEAQSVLKELKAKHAQPVPSTEPITTGGVEE